MVPGASRAHAISAGKHLCTLSSSDYSWRHRYLMIAEWASLSRMRSSTRRILRIMVCSCVEDLTHGTTLSPVSVVSPHSFSVSFLVPVLTMLRSPLSVVKLVPCSS